MGTELAARAVVDEAGFRALFSAEFAYVRHSLRRLGVREADLDDVTHDVFVIAYRRFADYDTNRPARPWLFGIAFRVASDHRRLARNRRELLDDGTPDDRADEAPAADEAIASKQARELVLAALERLDLDRRAVLILHDLDGEPIPDVASALGIPLNTAYSRLRSAREQLRAVLQRWRLMRGPP